MIWVKHFSAVCGIILSATVFCEVVNHYAGTDFDALGLIAITALSLAISLRLEKRP